MFPLQPSRNFEDAAGLGHPYVRAAVEAKVVALRKEGRSMRAIARELVKGISPFNASWLHDHPYRSTVWFERFRGRPCATSGAASALRPTVIMIVRRVGPAPPQ